MAGFRHHAAQGHIAELLSCGREQGGHLRANGGPGNGEGRRSTDVVRVITPGLCLEPGALDARTHNYLLAVCVDDDAFAYAALELTTSELRVGSAPHRDALLSALWRFEPREVLVLGQSEFRDVVAKALPRAAVRIDAGADGDKLDEALARALATDDAQNTALQAGQAERRALGAVVRYAAEAEPQRTIRFERLLRDDASASFVLDAPAVQNLEILRTLGGDRKGSLLHLVDHTVTAMGARLLRERLLAPSAELDVIERRHGAVEALVKHAALRGKLTEALAGIGDLERLTTRAVHGLLTPRELAAIREALAACARVKAVLDAAGHDLSEGLRQALPADLVSDLHAELERTLADEPPVVHTTGGVLCAGVSAELDDLRDVASNGKERILALEAREREATGIPSLKVKFTRVFGYYFEVTRANLRNVPERFRRKQTIANGERFSTEELDALQAKILGAEDRANAIEAELFVGLRDRVAEASPRIHRLCHGLAVLDVHASFAEVATRHEYVRPSMDDSRSLHLVESRHPVVEQLAAAGSFVPNDVRLDTEAHRLLLITGPNMAGKSTVMRQVALSVILAQAGGFVPARTAHIGLVDRIHTRVGASDNLSRGLSTFMVEMTEAATILREATSRSLVLLDEVGRGTSTYDGLAIAQAIAEHIHDRIGCRTMFATHYHELCALEATHAGVQNVNVAVKEHGDRIVFLHRLLPGSANRSYGIEVGRHAGLPEAVLARAGTLLGDLEAGSPRSPRGEAPAVPSEDPGKRRTHPVLTALRRLDPNRLTPLEALNELDRLRGEATTETLE
ncbi:MAG: DNA mismatch repair protein MutS [Polyangiales bacterium]